MAMVKLTTRIRRKREDEEETQEAYVNPADVVGIDVRHEHVEECFYYTRIRLRGEHTIVVWETPAEAAKLLGLA